MSLFSWSCKAQLVWLDLYLSFKILRFILIAIGGRYRITRRHQPRHELLILAEKLNTIDFTTVIFKANDLTFIIIIRSRPILFVCPKGESCHLKNADVYMKPNVTLLHNKSSFVLFYFVGLWDVSLQLKINW